MENDLSRIGWRGWKIVNKLGSGSFGSVYEIHRNLPDGTVEKAALKVLSVPQNGGEIDNLRLQGIDDETITASFQKDMEKIVQEYSVMLELNGHSNIVNCHEMQCVEQDNHLGYDIYIRMELLKPLKSMLGAEYSEEETIKLGIDLCSALEVCQKKNVLHRDIKPENIMVSDFGNYKLGDFGVAKLSQGNSTATTYAGTPPYMAPEVSRHEHYGSTADLYSLGLVLYWMMNRKVLPFMPLPPAIPQYQERSKAIERRIAGEELPAPVNGSPELWNVVKKASAFLPEDRFQSPNEMKEALERVRAASVKRHLIVKIRGNVDTVVYDGKPHSISGFTTNVEHEKIAIALQSPDTATVSGKEIQKYSMGLTQSDFVVKTLDPSLVIDDIIVEDGHLSIIPAKNPIKKAIIRIAILLAVILSAFAIFKFRQMKASEKRTQEYIEELRNNQQTEAPSATQAANPSTVTPSTSVTQPPSVTQETTPYSNLSVGSTVKIGTYEQDGVTSNGAEAIEWVVLEVQNGEALLISTDILLCGKYNDVWASLSWEKCTLRSWLNDSFYKTVFSTDERKYVQESVVKAEPNPQYRTGAGNDTHDKVFILSISEAERYLSKNNMLNGYATANAAQGGVRVTTSGKSWYWLRSPGEDRTTAAYVTTDGVINKKGQAFNFGDGGVRPSIRISIR